MSCLVLYVWSVHSTLNPKLCATQHLASTSLAQLDVTALHDRSQSCAADTMCGRGARSSRLHLTSLASQVKSWLVMGTCCASTCAAMGAGEGGDREAE